MKEILPTEKEIVILVLLYFHAETNRSFYVPFMISLIFFMQKSTIRLFKTLETLTNLMKCKNECIKTEFITVIFVNFYWDVRVLRSFICS